MAPTAAHLADHVIPPVPVRQWVISVPKRLRGFLADRPRAVAALIVAPEWAGMVPPVLLEYAKALAPIRASGLTEHADFPYGM